MKIPQAVIAGLALVLCCQVEAQRVVVGGGQDECSSEKVHPNLVLKSTTRLTGRIKDQSGAFFETSAVELRTEKPDGSQSTYKKIKTDKQGNFDFGEVAPGHYRLLASPHRGFRQPATLECHEDKKCNLELTLKANPTDMEFAECPIQ